MRSRMQGETNIAAVGALLAEPARAKVLLALADGRSLAASVLAAEAGVTASTASHHLARLLDAGLVTASARGRHRYYSLAGPQVAELIEAVARVAPPQPVTSLREGTHAHAVRYARRCYDHLAGRVGVAVADALADGRASLAEIGVGECEMRSCLDWTEQRPHVAGPLGRALLARFLELGWLEPAPRGRALRVTDAGGEGLRGLGVELP
jgi:DNA-binding transcriptional ArsR family regulator